MKVSYKLINDTFRGKVYGNHDIFTAASFRDFVTRHDIDLTRAVNAYDDGAIVGTLLFAQRGERAWLSLLGILPAYRRSGLGRALFVESLEALESSGVRSMEFESIVRNGPVRALYTGFGFEDADRLVIWARGTRSRATNNLRAKARSLAEVQSIARTPATCWQREPLGVARAKSSALIECDGAYAFVRVRDNSAVVLDAGARDVAAAEALARELDARVPYDITLVNEPEGSPLSQVLGGRRGWRALERQYRMVRLR